jgi:hypothetical protein
LDREKRTTEREIRSLQSVTARGVRVLADAELAKAPAKFANTDGMPFFPKPLELIDIPSVGWFVILVVDGEHPQEHRIPVTDAEAGRLNALPPNGRRSEAYAILRSNKTYKSLLDRYFAEA